MTLRLYRPALLAGIAVFLAGCTTLFPESCEQFDARRKQTNYSTTYQLDSTAVSADVKPLQKNEVAVVRSYQMKLNTERTRPCSHVEINKELVLLRRDQSGLVLEETREFFAEDGARIAVKTEVLTSQLTQSGHYQASVPLPIPKKAPPGKYRLTSTIVLKIKGKTVTLAKTSASFQVTALKQ